jgi:hypothetical protein
MIEWTLKPHILPVVNLSALNMELFKFENLTFANRPPNYPA